MILHLGPEHKIDKSGGGGRTRTYDLRIMRPQAGSAPFATFFTLLLFSTVSKSADLIRSAW